MRVRGDEREKFALSDSFLFFFTFEGTCDLLSTRSRIGTKPGQRH